MNKEEGSFCQATPAAPAADYLTQRLPRYRRCSLTTTQLSRVYGLNVFTLTGIKTTKKLAYYSSHGSITDVLSKDKRAIDMALIVIHGASRNADDYFCSAMAAVKYQTAFSNVLVLAPVFMEDVDALSPSSDFLIWDHQDGNGSWRYGSNSLYGSISSFSALDQMVETLQKDLEPFVEIVITGHSSGGQMVNRWSFLTNSWQANVKAIVANPSSFLYLTDLRRINGEWKLPLKDSCPNYNTWEWGLDEGGDMDVPYRDMVMANSSRVSTLLEQFRNKTVVYLSGSLDRCNSTTSFSMPSEICHAHGLEITCMDELQGINRLERSKIYMESLTKIVWKSLRHKHIHVHVSGVGHDHSLMFNSPEGMQTMFKKKHPKAEFLVEQFKYQDTL
jgi:hypothetical protein